LRFYTPRLTRLTPEVRRKTLKHSNKVRSRVQNICILSTDYICVRVDPVWGILITLEFYSWPNVRKRDHLLSSPRNTSDRLFFGGGGISVTLEKSMLGSGRLCSFAECMGLTAEQRNYSLTLVKFYDCGCFDTPLHHYVTVLLCQQQHDVADCEWDSQHFTQFISNKTIMRHRKTNILATLFITYWGVP
jgi:hypothetical protein